MKTIKALNIPIIKWLRILPFLKSCKLSYMVLQMRCFSNKNETRNVNYFKSREIEIMIMDPNHSTH